MIPTLVFELRKRLGLSQRGLAIAVGLKGRQSRRTVRRWERGEQPVTAHFAQALKALTPESAQVIALAARYPFERAGLPYRE